MKSAEPMNERLITLPVVEPGEIRVMPYELGYIARAHVKDGFVHFSFTEISHARQSLEGVLEIDVAARGEESKLFVQRIDLRSASAIRSLVTDLNNAFGGKRDENGYNWSLILNGVSAALSREIKKDQKPEYLGDMPFTEPTFLLAPFLQEGSPNLLFAQSEAGKTWLALNLGVSLITGTPFLGHPSPTGKKVMFVDYEDVKQTFASRLHKICAGSNLVYKDIAKNFPYYKPLGSVKENSEVLRKIIAEEAIDLIIIDAGGDAAGGSPSDEEKVLELFNALDSIPVTKLILHHEPKYVQSEAAAFYGSMYWKARSRVGWRLEVESEENSSKLIKASIHKRSNLPYIEPIYYKMHFNTTSLEEIFEGGKELIVPATKFEVVSKTQLNQGKDIEEAIIEVLEAEGGMTEAQIASFVGRDRSVVNRTLRQKLTALVTQKKSGKSTIWTLK